MSKPQITIKDIARELGVSPSTVSRALKDNPDISQETRDAIQSTRANIIISPTYWH
jgi:LacI family transcriptional regulator